MSEIIICTVPASEDCPSGVAIVCPAEGLSAQDVLKDIPTDTISHRITTRDNVPQDRTYRNAWTDENSTETVDVNMDRAREIHKNTLRYMREATFKRADADFMKALEEGDSEAFEAAKALKKALRDVTIDPSIEAAATPEELKEAIPDVLKD